MSDIDLHGMGYESLIGAWATIALGVLGLVIALVLALGRRGPGLERRLISYSSGPLACGGVGVIGAFVRMGWEGWFYVWPALGIAAGIAMARIARREQSPHENERVLYKR
jgi:hypothetical protein